MAPSKKPSNLAAKSCTAELTSNLKKGLFKNKFFEKLNCEHSDPSKNLAYPPGTFVVRRDAFRVWGLTEKVF